jgi:predicted RNA binding protein YcfA (HicA-like mRNA interferase family)
MTSKEFRTKVLKKLKFEMVRTKKHESLHLKSDSGKIWERTVVSHGNEEVGKGLRSKFIRQTGIASSEDFDLIFACTMSKEEYYRKKFNSDTLPNE